MFHVGERDYSKITGDSGPLVYPAGFVYIFGLFKWICGSNIRTGQILFGGIYLFTQFNVFQIYHLVGVTDVWPYVLLILSRRLHSLYVLRMFNDCVAMLFLYGSIFLLLKHKHKLSVITYSLSVSVKMNTLLFAPGFAYLLWNMNDYKSLAQFAVLAGSVQILLGLPFLIQHPISYLTCAFDFGRQFLFKWTVNWRFVPESLFMGPWFSKILLLLDLGGFYLYLRKIIANTRNISTRGTSNIHT